LNALSCLDGALLASEFLFGCFEVFGAGCGHVFGLRLRLRLMAAGPDVVR